jgi:hypothetical protein
MYFYHVDLFNSALRQRASSKKYFGGTVKRFVYAPVQGLASPVLRAKWPKATLDRLRPPDALNPL